LAVTSEPIVAEIMWKDESKRRGTGMNFWEVYHLMEYQRRNLRRVGEFIGLKKESSSPKEV
jgi:hypothetical protein